MNCKPGDIARYVGQSAEHYGKVVLVLGAAEQPTTSSLDGQWWEIDPPFGRFEKCHDSALRPIRDPGDDAVDEILQRVGRPESAAIEWALGAAKENAA